MRPRSLRSILLGLALAALLALTACGQQRQAEPYSEDYQENFMFGCREQREVPEDDPDDPQAGPQSPEDYCKCVYDAMEKKIPAEQAKEFEEQQADEDAGEIEVPKALQSIFDDCKGEG
ncbi:hypothetical protein [Dermatobacter hominis]|uniref:hypothetical protein n=1 Tax=Dermatobacter hominis TaxID=2884263 RepID=UPI001D0FDD31|nr:hypothetical protein [Dermatobacter hominis]UDY37240.1 hypothetical protein LH044_06800 [Dermatobacter hominis]